MIKYLKNSEISFRIGLNPFYWKIIPAVAFERPSEFYPKRRTFAFVFLFFQAFLDIDDGTHDLTPLTNFLAMKEVEAHDEPEQVGPKIPRIDKAGLDLE
jgi:hypothetical protein